MQKGPAHQSVSHNDGADEVTDYVIAANAFMQQVSPGNTPTAMAARSEMAKSGAKSCFL
jgi:hypothetical protein